VPHLRPRFSPTQNLKVLMNQPRQWVDKVRQRKPSKKIILDMDSSDSPTFGRQEGSAYNGHFGYTCYHPLFCFNQFGDIERALLRNGNVHSADARMTATSTEIEETPRGPRRRSVRICFKDPAEGRYWPALGLMAGENRVCGPKSGLLEPRNAI